MSGFKTGMGNYRGLGIVVCSYVSDVYYYDFYNSNEEWVAWRDEILRGRKAKPDAIYCFNGEKPLKEQARYADGSSFGGVLQEVISKELVDKGW